uniref:E-selectin n=1 Tax=Acanthochromis polyacanthus TaxID=80966 RepID=A0A3Q1FV28_9TELE
MSKCAGQISLTQQRLCNYPTVCFLLGISLAETTSGWTYGHSETTMNWTMARQWCQTSFTDMVVIQSQEENDYLVSQLPNRKKSPYYWIGITKTHKNETWTWIGNNSTWIGEHSWAPNEPNNNHSTEFCVEIYVNSYANRGKWNDEKCANSKYAVCYHAQCNSASCERGRCQETINSTTCLCEPGFKGDRCETVTCHIVVHPVVESTNSFSDESNYIFVVVFSSAIFCELKGKYFFLLPLTAEQCPVLNQTDFRSGRMNCSHPTGLHSYNSTCEFRCDEGYKLIGEDQIRCNHSGQWTASIPVCTGKVSFLQNVNYIQNSIVKRYITVPLWNFFVPPAVECPPLPQPENGYLSCSGGNQVFNTTCQFKCQLGHLMIGLSTVTCGVSGVWSGPRPACESKYAFILKALLFFFKKEKEKMAKTVNDVHIKNLYFYRQ